MSQGHGNITLSLPRELIRRLRHLAVDRHTSVSRLVRELVEKSLDDEQRYEKARERQLALMEQGLDMGLASWEPGPRDALHER